MAGPSNWDMIQKSVKNTPGHDQETFHCHKTIRQGRDSKTQQDEFIHLTSQGAYPTRVRNGLFCDDHMWKSATLIVLSISLECELFSSF